MEPKAEGVDLIPCCPSFSSQSAVPGLKNVLQLTAESFWGISFVSTGFWPFRHPPESQIVSIYLAKKFLLWRWEDRDEDAEEQEQEEAAARGGEGEAHRRAGEDGRVAAAEALSGK